MSDNTHMNAGEGKRDELSLDQRLAEEINTLRLEGGTRPVKVALSQC